MIFKGEKIKKGDILKFQFSAKEFSSKNNTNPKLGFVLLACGEQKNASIDLNFYALDSLNIQFEWMLRAPF